MGDHGLLRQRKLNNRSTPYEPVFYTVIEDKGSAVTARRITDGRELQQDASQLKIAKILMYQENADDGSQREGWRDKLLMGAANMKDQPLSQKSVEQENLPEQKTTTESVQEDPTEKSGGGGSQQEEAARAVNHEVGMLSSTVRDTSKPFSSSTRPTRPKRTRRRPAYLSEFVTLITRRYVYYMYTYSNLDYRMGTE